MNPALILGIIFVLMCYAFYATMYMIDLQHNIADLHAQLIQSRKVAEHLRTVAAKANLDCYQRHAELYGDKPNA